MIKDYFFTLNGIGGVHAIPVSGYIYDSGRRIYGIYGAYGLWRIIDIATGCQCGKVEKLKDVKNYITAELEQKIAEACRKPHLLEAMEIIKRAYTDSGRLEEKGA